jgi:hypothetical protein
MSHISNLITSSIEDKELHDHCSSVIKIVLGQNLEDAKLSKFTERLVEDNKDLKVALNRERKSPFTNLLRTQDDVRDNWFRCLTGHVRADLLRPVEEVAKAAKRTFRILQNHGLLLYRGSYEKESTQLESLFEDLDKAPQQEDLGKLGMIEVYGALKQAQKEFSKTYVERINDLAEKERLVAASYVQKKVKHELGVLIQYIDVMVSGEEASFDKLAKALDELTEQMNKKIRARLTAEAKKKEKESSEVDRE